MIEILNSLTKGLTPQGASFLGTLAGSSLGLLAILLGALFNGYLNRRRDIRLREDDRVALAAALRAELNAIGEACARNSKEMEIPDERRGTHVLGDDPNHMVIIFPTLVDRLGLLPPVTIQKVVETYGVIAGIITHYERLGGSIYKSDSGRITFGLPYPVAPTVAAMLKEITVAIESTVSLLDRELPRVPKAKAKAKANT